MLPAAPTRLSTITGCPSVSASFCAIERAMTSVLPPAAKLTTRRIDFAGQACACASGAIARASAAPASQRVIGFMVSSPSGWGRNQYSVAAAAAASGLTI
jgi:hypothetical protein